MCDQIPALFRKEFLNWARSPTPILKDFTLPTILGLVFSPLLWNDIFQYDLVPMLIPSCLSVFCSNLMYEIVQDKSEKMKEYLKIYGMSSFSYLFSKWIFAFIRALICVGLTFLGIVFANRSPLTTDEIINIGILFVVYAIASVNLTFAVSKVFYKPRLAADIYLVLFFLASGGFFMATLQTGENVYFYSSIVPQLSLNYGIYSIFMTYNDYRNLDGIISINEAIIIMSANIAIFYLLFLLFAWLFSDQYGIKRGFITLKIKGKRFKKIQPDEVSSINVPLISSATNDISSAKHHEVFENPLMLKKQILLKQITKRYHKNIVLRGISMMIYESQITCFLGHSKSGKSTLLDLMLGMIEYDRGDIYFDDVELYRESESIRRNIGYCPQKDIFYDDLTVGEHLKMILTLRKVQKDKISTQQHQLLRKLGLKEYQKVKIKRLTPSLKKKVSLATALAGNPRILILDEITSGVDEAVKNEIWDILRDLRQEGVCIVMSTHDLQEAQQIGDRIAILSKGLLHSVGSFNYFKKQFGEGYKLNITPSIPANTDEREKKVKELRFTIEDIVKKTLDNYKQSGESDTETLTYLVPFSLTEQLAELFQILEVMQDVTFKLTANTIEDTYFKIGQDEYSTEGFGSINTEIPPIPENFSEVPKSSTILELKAYFVRCFINFFFSLSGWLLLIVPIGGALLGIYLLKPDFNDNVSSFRFTSFVAVAFAFHAIHYAAFLVQEREENLRYMLKVMGSRTALYWIGTLLFDLVLMLIALIAIIVPCHFLDIPVFKDLVGMGSLTMLAFGCSLVTSTYFYGYLFSKSNTVYKFFGLFATFVQYVIPYIASYVIFESHGIVMMEELLRYFGYIIGPFTILQEQFQTYVTNPAHLFPTLFTETTIFYPIILFSQAGIFFVLAVLIEKSKFKLLLDAKLKVQDEEISQASLNSSQIVQEEEQRVISWQNKDVINVYGLKKTYPNGFEALRDVSFGIEKKQIFGVVGPVGSGKSTIFNIIAGFIPNSGGAVKVKEREIDMNLQYIFEDMGVCTQKNSLWENLTVRQHLNLFGNLKGLYGKTLSENINFYLKTLQLEEVSNKKPKNLSIGNQRRLCVAIALIGSPSIQLYDNPTAGLDPVTRKYFFEILKIQKQEKDTCIFMSCQSMAEAEAVCDKIGILVNGKFILIGDTTFLKNRYERAYRIKIWKKDIQNMEAFKKEIKSSIPTLTEAIDGSSDSITYQVLKDDIEFSKLMRSMHEMKKEKLISGFALTHASLEELYMNYSKFQKDNIEEKE